MSTEASANYGTSASKKSEALLRRDRDFALALTMVEGLLVCGLGVADGDDRRVVFD
jgi:hypothetical protein